MVRVWLLSLAMLLAFAPSATAQIPANALVRTDLYVWPAYDSKRDPKADLQLALAKASATHRNVLIDVGGNWCMPCLRLDDYLARNDEVGNAFKASFVMVKVNWDPKNTNRAFLWRYPKINGYPHFFVLDSTGKFLKSQNTGWFSNRHSYNSARFLDFARSWRPKADAPS